MGGDERLELADQLGVATEREVGFDPLLERRDTCLLQSRDLILRERRQGEVGQRRPSPKRQSLQQRVGGKPWTPGRERAPAFVDELLEAVGVQLSRLNPKHVTGS